VPFAVKKELNSDNLFENYGSETGFGLVTRYHILPPDVKKFGQDFCLQEQFVVLFFGQKNIAIDHPLKAPEKKKILGRYVPVYERVTSRRQKFLNTEAALADFSLTALFISNMPLYNA